MRSTAPPEPRWQQSWFPGLDGAAAYTLVRRRRPARILEIGSGHSTRFLARAVRDGGMTTAIHCLDPAPRASLDRLDVRVSRRTLQDTDLDELPALAPGDVLFVDSSHLALPGSDVELIFSRLLPRLAAGVLVHVHDVLLPDPYPETWRWRAYGEHIPVAAWLAAGGLRPLFSSAWVRRRMPDALPDAVAAIPVPSEAVETSLWAVTTVGPPGQPPESSAAITEI